MNNAGGEIPLDLLHKISFDILNFLMMKEQEYGVKFTQLTTTHAMGSGWIVGVDLGYISEIAAKIAADRATKERMQTHDDFFEGREL